MDVLRHVAQFQVAANSARAGQQPYQRSQPAAVDKDHLAEMQDNVPAILQEPADMVAQ